MGFDGASAIMHDSQMDDALYLKPSDPMRLSGEGSTVGIDFDIPGRDDAFASGLDDYGIYNQYSLYCLYFKCFYVYIILYMYM